MVVKTNKERLNEIIQLTITDGLPYDGSLDDINYFSLLCKSSNKNQLFKLLGANLCMFTHLFQDKKSIMMVFSMPINLSPEISGKHISERVMDIVGCVEDCFTTLDYVDLKEVKEDKTSYITIIKTLNNGEENERKESKETKKGDSKRSKGVTKTPRRTKAEGSNKG
jgi:hypothetical protein